MQNEEVGRKAFVIKIESIKMLRVLKKVVGKVGWGEWETCQRNLINRVLNKH